MYRLNNVTKKFGENLILKGINLHIKLGKITGVIGHSGAGKSTLLRLLNLLEDFNSGDLYFKDTKIINFNEQKKRKLRQETSMIFQHFNLLNQKTIYENIALPLRLRKSKNIDFKIRELAELTGLTDQLNKYPSQLSGGQKQRVGIARALSTNPSVLLCDEATSALDPETTGQILDLLLEINKKLNLTIIVITHEMNVIKQICDEVVVIDSGIVVESGLVGEVFKKPQHKTTKSFLSSLSFESNEEIDFAPLKKLYPNSTILELHFDNSTAFNPVINSLVKKFSIGFNVISGSIYSSKSDTLGSLLIQFFDYSDFNLIIQELNIQNVSWEVKE